MKRTENGKPMNEQDENSNLGDSKTKNLASDDARYSLQAAMNFGNNLKNIRISLCLTQTELARKSGIKQQNISRWEMGMHYPNILECAKLANILCVDLNEFVE